MELQNPFGKESVENAECDNLLIKKYTYLWRWLHEYCIRQYKWTSQGFFFATGATPFRFERWLTGITTTLSKTNLHCHSSSAFESGRIPFFLFSPPHFFFFLKWISINSTYSFCFASKFSLTTSFLKYVFLNSFQTHDKNRQRPSVWLQCGPCINPGEGLFSEMWILSVHTRDTCILFFFPWMPELQ